MLCWMLVQEGQTAVRFDPELRRDYYRLKFRRGASVAHVAVARKLALRLDWRLCKQAEAVQAAQPVRPCLSMGELKLPSII